MLGKDEPRPVCTSLMIQTRPLVVASSILIPAIAVAMLFVRKLPLAIYILGALFVVVLFQLVSSWHALLTPLFRIIEKMNTPR